MAKKKQKWLKPRHKFIRIIALPFLHIYMKMKYRVKIEKFKGKGQYLIISNHQTAFDQFFVDVAFPGAVYYIASEDLFSIGFVSKIIKYLVAPIPIKKSMTDLRAVLNCVKVAKEGGTIALFPEGNRTFDGKTVYMKEAIAALVKKLALPIAIFRIEGGFGVHPRWSDVVRKGKMRAYVKEVITYDDYKDYSDEELYNIICEKLYVDEGKADGSFYHKKSAEYLERAMYYCPHCGFSEWYSEGDIVSCKKCGIKVRYLPTKELDCVNGEFPYRFLTEWYDAQCKFMNGADLSLYKEEAFASDVARFSEVIPYNNKQLIAEDAKLSVFADRYEIEYNNEKTILTFDEIVAVSVLGKNKLNIYAGSRIFQIKSHKRFCAVKYMNMYYRMVRKEDENDEFLGLLFLGRYKPYCDFAFKFACGKYD